MNITSVIFFTQGEQQGSLAFVRSEEAANIDFKKQFGSEFADMMPDIMADMNHDLGVENISVTSIV